MENTVLGLFIVIEKLLLKTDTEHYISVYFTHFTLCSTKPA